MTPMAPAPPRLRPPRTEARALLRIAPGEELRLTPEGPTAAVILSRAPLPLRTHAEGRPPLRATFPGTAVAIGAETFEVIEARSGKDGMQYRLERWPEDQIERDRVVYDAAFIGSVQRLRELLAAQQRARAFGWALYPLIGLLPEELQARFCERFGLEAPRATIAGGVFEAVACLALVVLLGIVAPSVASLMVVLMICLAFIAPAIGRAIAAMLLGEVSGTWPLLFLVGLVGEVRQERALASWLSRADFLRLAAKPDAITDASEPGAYVVTSPLPHVTWEPTARFEFEGEEWHAQAFAPRLEGDALVFSYGLAPSGVPTGTSPDEQRRRAASLYRDTSEAHLRRHWAELGESLPWVVALFPREDQRRAVAAGTETAVLRRGAILSSACFEIPAAILLLLPGTGHDWLMIIVGLLLAGEAAWRIREARAGRPAPALVGRLLAPIFSPVSRALREHREALRLAWGRLVASL